jgi:hypothetical protein
MIEVHSRNRAESPGRERLSAMQTLQGAVASISNASLGQVLSGMFAAVIYFGSLFVGRAVAARDADEGVLPEDGSIWSSADADVGVNQKVDEAPVAPAQAAAPVKPGSFAVAQAAYDPGAGFEDTLGATGTGPTLDAYEIEQSGDHAAVNSAIETGANRQGHDTSSAESSESGESEPTDDAKTAAEDETDPQPEADEYVIGNAFADTIELFGGNDRVDAGDGDDLVVAGDGNDVINGGGGNDVLDGEDGNDVIAGDAGDDLLVGQAGDDRLMGGAGNDRMSGGEGRDLLDGGEGRDILLGGNGDDLLAGGLDNDILRGGAGEDILDGESGDDTLWGNAGDDLLMGGAGDDELQGGDGDDRLTGGAGRDILDGGAGNDILIADEGADTLWDGMGADLFMAGAGDDTIHVLSDADVDLIDGGSGDDVLDVSAATTTARIDIADGTVRMDGGIADRFSSIEVFAAGDAMDEFDFSAMIPETGTTFYQIRNFGRGDTILLADDLRLGLDDFGPAVEPRAFGSVNSGVQARMSAFDLVDAFAKQPRLSLGDAAEDQVTIRRMELDFDGDGRTDVDLWLTGLLAEAEPILDMTI